MTDFLSRMVLVLVRTEGPINLGMVARLCGNLGIRELRLVQPQCEVNCEDSRKFSTHSKEFMLAAPIFADLGAAVADCGLVIGSSARFRHHELGVGMRISEVPDLLARRPAERFALVFGNEADGQSEAELRHCQAWFHLEAPGANAAYNLAMSVAIAGYTLGVGLSPSAPDPLAGMPPAADRVHVDRLYQYWLESLERFQYFRRTDRARFAPQLQRFLGRLHLGEHDVQVLRGMLAQFNYFAFGERFSEAGGATTEADAEADAVPAVGDRPNPGG